MLRINAQAHEQYDLVGIYVAAVQNMQILLGRILLQLRSEGGFARKTISLNIGVGGLQKLGNRPVMLLTETEEGNRLLKT